MYHRPGWHDPVCSVDTPGRPWVDEQQTDSVLDLCVSNSWNFAVPASSLHFSPESSSQGNSFAVLGPFRAVGT